MNMYMWNLEKWCRQKYLQGRNRDTESGLVDLGLGGRGG